MLSLLLFKIVVDVNTTNDRRDAIDEVSFADDLALMSKNHTRFQKEVLESKGSS